MFTKGAGEEEKTRGKKRTNFYEVPTVRQTLGLRCVMPFAIPRILLEVRMSQIIFQLLLAFLHVCAIGWMLSLQGEVNRKGYSKSLASPRRFSLSLSLSVIEKFSSLLVFSASH